MKRLLLLYIVASLSMGTLPYASHASFQEFIDRVLPPPQQKGEKATSSAPVAPEPPTAPRHPVSPTNNHKENTPRKNIMINEDQVPPGFYVPPQATTPPTPDTKTVTQPTPDSGQANNVAPSNNPQQPAQPVPTAPAPTTTAPAKELNPPPTPYTSPRTYIRNLYQAAIMEDGSKVEIFTDAHNNSKAHIVGPGGRKLLLPNGHYELLEGKLYRLQPHNFELTNDTSILLSIYQGKVINYLPRWAVVAGEFQDFDAD